MCWAYFNVDKGVAFFRKDGPHVILLRVLDILRKSAPRQAHACQAYNESGVRQQARKREVAGATVAKARTSLL